MGNVKRIISEATAKSSEALLEYYGAALTRLDGEPAWLEYIAVIGWTADEIRGTFGLAMCADLISHTHVHIMGAKPDDRMKADWLGELVNQLAGRVKIELANYGVDIAIATPLVLRGVSLRVTPRGEEVWSIPYRADFGTAIVWIDARHDPELTLEKREIEDEDTLLCGDSALFF